MRVFIIGILGWLILLAAGAFVDVYLLLVHGIREIVQGAQAHPLSGNLIGWGAAHVVFSGIGFFIAVVLGVGLTALLASME
jgi:hypothetical protein